MEIANSRIRLLRAWDRGLVVAEFLATLVGKVSLVDQQEMIPNSKVQNRLALSARRSGSLNHLSVSRGLSPANRSTNLTIFEPESFEEFSGASQVKATVE